MPFVDELWSAMRILPKLKQRMIYRRYYYGETKDEISIALNIPLITVKRHLDSALETIEEYFSIVSRLGYRETIVHMREKSGKVERRGNGQRPDKTQNKILACIDRPAVSQNPSPDTYYESPEREDFMEALAECCRSAIAQVGPSASVRGEYGFRAGVSRERIAEMRITEAKRIARRAA